MRITLAYLGFALLIGGCGGGGAARPGPLSAQLDDMHLAPVPVSDKGNVVASKQELDIALMEKAKAQSDATMLDTELSVARNDGKQADLKMENAQTEKEAAAKSANMNRVADAEKKVTAARVGQDAAAAKVAWLESRKDSLDKTTIYQEWNVSARDARFQLEKAKVAKQNNISPAGFDMAAFEKQAQDRSDGARRAKSEADLAMQGVKAKEQAYQAKQRELDAASK